jgi:hypothetical protein
MLLMTLQQWLSMYFDVDIQEKFENTKVVARSRKAKKYRTNNDQTKKHKGQTNNGRNGGTMHLKNKNRTIISFYIITNN